MYIWESLVKVINNKSKLFAINCTMQDTEISIPPVELRPIEKLRIKSVRFCGVDTNYSEELEKRIKNIKIKLELDKLNQKERKSVEHLI